MLPRVTIENERAAPRLRPVGPGHPIEPRLAVLPVKLQPPPTRPGMVPRRAIVDRLMTSQAARVVLVRAPAGYGKTSLLAQWAEADPRDVAWISLDRHDDDPIVLLAYVAAAIHRIEPLDPEVARTIAGPASSVRTRLMPALAGAMAAIKRPVLFVLDDVHELRDPDALDSVGLLAAQLPRGSQVALAARAEPNLPIARLRARGELLELSAEDIALDVDEAAHLLAAAGLDLPRADVAELARRTEGWPAGLYLAALTIQAGGPAAGSAASFSDRDRGVEDYLRSEIVSALPARELRFLARTSVLDRLSAPLCDAVVGRRGSAAVLASIERANLFLVPLDHAREWYRYHPLFRAMLQAELERREPGLRTELQVRAADWCEANGFLEEALGYAFEAGDLDRAAVLFERLALPVFRSGRLASQRRWLERFDDASLERHPATAALAGLGFAFVGDAAQADRWVSVAARGDDVPADPSTPGGSGASAGALVAMARAATMPDGADLMLHDATIAVELVPDWSPFRAFALVVAGVAQGLVGDVASARTTLAAAAETGERLDAQPARSIALSELALLAIDRRDWSAAESYATKARSVVVAAGLEGYPVTALAFAVTARMMTHRGDHIRARSDLTHLAGIVPFLTWAVPWLAIQARLEMARAHLGLGEVAAARALVDGTDEILAHRRDVGTLRPAVDAIRGQVAASAGATRADSLTEAELRLVPLLPTHLSFIEIAELQVLSPNTVKSQAISIYRKLGASSRSDAVARARELGLLER
jgi:LuxR family transcriptional regulator, maltose regulon positive regulatory protein